MLTKNPSVSVRRGVINRPSPEISDGPAEKIGALAQGLDHIGRLFHGKIRVAAGKGPDLVAVLLNQRRTGDVDDAAARLDQAGRALQHGLLLLDALGERARANSPLGVGIAPPCAGAGARRIDQNEIGAAGEIAQDIGCAGA